MVKRCLGAPLALAPSEVEDSFLERMESERFLRIIRISGSESYLSVNVSKMSYMVKLGGWFTMRFAEIH